MQIQMDWDSQIWEYVPPDILHNLHHADRGHYRLSNIIAQRDCFWREAWPNTHNCLNQVDNHSMILSVRDNPGVLHAYPEVVEACTSASTLQRACKLATKTSVAN